MLTANDVADFFLSSIDSEPDGENISNLKLQKLLYYAQGIALSILGRPLFMDPICHWQHGPVVSTVYHQYKSYGSAPLPISYIEPEKYQEEDILVLNYVRREYGQYSAWKLRDMTHQEEPWLATANGSIISQEMMNTFFKNKVGWTFDYDFKRIKERVEGTFVAMPDSVVSHDDFEAWIKAQ